MDFALRLTLPPGGKLSHARYMLYMMYIHSTCTSARRETQPCTVHVVYTQYMYFCPERNSAMHDTCCKCCIYTVYVLLPGEKLNHARYMLYIHSTCTSARRETQPCTVHVVNVVYTQYMYFCPEKNSAMHGTCCIIIYTCTCTVCCVERDQVVYIHVCVLRTISYLLCCVRECAPIAIVLDLQASTPTPPSPLTLIHM